MNSLIKKEKLLIIFQALWLFFMLPIASLFSKVDLFKQIFVYIILTYPAWFSYVWDWYFEAKNTKISNKVFVVLFIFSVVLTIFLEGGYIDEYIDGYMDEYFEENFISYLPSICLGGFILLNLRSFPFVGKVSSFILNFLIQYKKPVLGLVAIVIALLITFDYVSKKIEKYKSEKRFEEYFVQQKKDVFEFTPYTQEQIKNAISLKDFLKKIENLTTLQKNDYLESTRGSIIIGSGLVEKVGEYKYSDCTYKNYPCVTILSPEIVYATNFPGSSYKNTQNIKVEFNQRNGDALTLEKNKPVIFIGRFENYIEGSQKVILKQVQTATPKNEVISK